MLFRPSFFTNNQICIHEKMKVSTATDLRITMHKAHSHFSFNPLHDSKSCRESKSCTPSFNLFATACNEKANGLQTISGQQQSAYCEEICIHAWLRFVKKLSK